MSTVIGLWLIVAGLCNSFLKQLCVEQSGSIVIFAIRSTSILSECIQAVSIQSWTAERRNSSSELAKEPLPHSLNPNIAL